MDEEKQMLEPIIEIINLCAKEELERANKDNPPFRSKHEAFGVLAEELWEAREEINSAMKTFDELTEDVFSDYDQDLQRDISQLRLYAVAGASELVQVIAMCDKWKEYYARKGM